MQKKMKSVIPRVALCAIALFGAAVFSPVFSANVGMAYVEAEGAYADIGAALGRAVERAFAQSGRFSVAPIEHVTLVAAQSKIPLQFRFRANTAKELQNVTGADYFVALSVNSYRESTKDGNSFVVADVSARIYGAHTGRLIFAPRLREERSAPFLPPISANDPRFFESLGGETLTALAEKLFDDFYARIEPKPPLSGIVTRIDGKTVYVNRGVLDGVKAGMQFGVFIPTTNALAAPIAHSNVAAITNDEADDTGGSGSVLKVDTSEHFPLLALTPKYLFPASFFEYERVGRVRVVEVATNYSLVEVLEAPKGGLATMMLIRELPPNAGK